MVRSRASELDAAFARPSAFRKIPSISASHEARDRSNSSSRASLGAVSSCLVLRMRSSIVRFSMASTSALNVENIGRRYHGNRRKTRSVVWTTKRAGRRQHLAPPAPPLPSPQEGTRWGRGTAKGSPRLLGVENSPHHHRLSARCAALATGFSPIFGGPVTTLNVDHGRRARNRVGCPQNRRRLHLPTGGRS